MNFRQVESNVFVNLSHVVWARLLEGQKADSSKPTKELLVRFVDGAERTFQGEAMLNLILALRSETRAE